MLRAVEQETGKLSVDKSAHVVNRYRMSYSLVRTSVSLDRGTLELLAVLARRWSVSKAEVMRRAIRKAKEDADGEDQRPSPLQAMHR